MCFQVDETNKTPIYRQIADWLAEQITCGELPAGHRLLTERELCALLQVARGTVKNAYEELENRGLIQKVQGRGTFVRGGSPEQERVDATNAVHRAVDRLRVLGLSELELVETMRREAWLRLEETEKIRVAWVDCSPELLKPAVEQIAQTCGVTATPYLLADVVDNLQMLQQPFDLIATSLMHHKELSAVMPELQVERLALSVCSRTVTALARLCPNSRVAVLYQSSNFRARVQEELADLSLAPQCIWLPLHTPADALPTVLEGCRAVIVPPSYPPAMDEIIRFCEMQGMELLPFEYLLDHGSLLHLLERAQACWLERVARLLPTRNDSNSTIQAEW